MKISLFGVGKTGSKILDVVAKDDEVMAYDSKTQPKLEILKQSDVNIVFVPMDKFIELSPLLLDSGLPTIVGTTGPSWPAELLQQIEQRRLHWIWGTNFAIGMRIIKKMLEAFAVAPDIYENYKFKIHEVHHTQKLDAPSGTAKSWAEWLGKPCEITFERTGDIVGDHSLTLQTPYEQITLEHHAHDRRIFAAGAVWAARALLHNPPSEYGCIRFEDFTDKHFIALQRGQK